jgi:hypothetical protein
MQEQAAAVPPTRREDLEIEGDCGIFRPRGECTMAQAVGIVAAAMRLARAHGVRKLLVDTTGLTGMEPPPLAMRYQIGQLWAEAVAGDLDVALVAHPALIDPQKFVVTVATNRGARANVFTSEVEALAWLHATQ